MTSGIADDIWVSRWRYVERGMHTHGHADGQTDRQTYLAYPTVTWLTSNPRPEVTTTGPFCRQVARIVAASTINNSAHVTPCDPLTSL